MVDVTRRERKHAATTEEIKSAAWEQIANYGVHGLSLGSIARSMGLTTPALYYYFDSRDDLLAALISDAYDSLADDLELALAGLTLTAYSERFRALVLGYRDWAMRHPHHYTLTHGGVSKGSAAPAEGALRCLVLFGTLLQAAHDDKGLTIPHAYLAPPPSLEASLTALQQQMGEVVLSEPIITIAIMTWVHVHALVWQEVDQHLLTPLLQHGDLYRMEVEVLVERLGL